MKEIQKHISDLLHVDPLSDAEKMTGKSYKEDELTSMLGFSMHINKGEKLRELISKADDTQFSSSVEEYLRVVGRAGFEVVLCDSVANSTDEHFYILYNSQFGILISFDTHRWDASSKENVNGGNVHYNWSPNSFDSKYGLTASGHYAWDKVADELAFFEPDFQSAYSIPNLPKVLNWEIDTEGWEDFKVRCLPIDIERQKLQQEAMDSGKRILWIGKDDCREALLTRLLALSENGTFSKKWIEQPFFWFVAHDESKIQGCDYKKITAQRFNRLPQHVKDNLGPYKP